MITATIPNLDPTTEKGFKLDSGELIAVKITRPQLDSKSVVSVTVAARGVDAQGATIMIAGLPAEMPGHTISFLVESLGDASVVLLPEIAAAMEREAMKVRGFMSALTALSSFAQDLPAATPTPVTP